jgi:uncharacterized protein YaaR (DUF327 family)
MDGMSKNMIQYRVDYVQNESEKYLQSKTKENRTKFKSFLKRFSKKIENKRRCGQWKIKINFCLASNLLVLEKIIP